MSIFNKNRRDADWIKPKDSIQALVPFIMPRRSDAEVSSQVEIDVTKLVKFVDDINKKDELEYKMTYFHALAACFAKTIYSREALNNFVKNKRLYHRKKVTLGFIAKNKLSDKGEERIVCLEADKKDNIMSLSRKMAIDIFQAKGDKDNDMEGVMKMFTSIPNWLLSIVVKIVFFMDEHDLSPKSLTQGDTNYVTVLLSNLGSIQTNSCYHHLNEYGTNSIVLTIGTIHEVNNKKYVDLQLTLDERIADGFYFAKSIQLTEYIAKHPELLLEDFEIKVENKKD